MNSIPLSGFKVRKALELDLTIEEIFQINLEEEGDIAAKEIFEDDYHHTCYIDNVKEIFGDDYLICYSTKKEVIKINENLNAYLFDFYICNLEHKDINDSPISSEKTSEIVFLNTKKVDYYEFVKNIMDAHQFLGQYDIGPFKKRFSGIGSFDMEDYALNHLMITLSDIHLLDFFIEDSNIVSSISKIIVAGYEQDVIDQKSYFKKADYDKMLKTVKKHKKYISKGFDLGLK